MIICSAKPLGKITWQKTQSGNSNEYYGEIQTVNPFQLAAGKSSFFNLFLHYNRYCHARVAKLFPEILFRYEQYLKICAFKIFKRGTLPITSFNKGVRGTHYCFAFFFFIITGIQSVCRFTCGEVVSTCISWLQLKNRGYFTSSSCAAWECFPSNSFGCQWGKRSELIWGYSLFFPVSTYLFCPYFQFIGSRRVLPGESSLFPCRQKV